MQLFSTLLHVKPLPRKRVNNKEKPRPHINYWGQVIHFLKYTVFENRLKKSHIPTFEPFSNIFNNKFNICLKRQQGRETTCTTAKSHGGWGRSCQGGSSQGDCGWGRTKGLSCPKRSCVGNSREPIGIAGTTFCSYLLMLRCCIFATPYSSKLQSVFKKRGSFSQ